MARVLVQQILLHLNFSLGRCLSTYTLLSFIYCHMLLLLCFALGCCGML